MGRPAADRRCGGAGPASLDSAPGALCSETAKILGGSPHGKGVGPHDGRSPCEGPVEAGLGGISRSRLRTVRGVDSGPPYARERGDIRILNQEHTHAGIYFVRCFRSSFL